MARGLNGSANGSSQWHGNERGVEARRPGGDSNLPPEVIEVLPAVVGLHTTVPEDRRSAQSLGVDELLQRRLLDLRDGLRPAAVPDRRN